MASTKVADTTLTPPARWVDSSGGTLIGPKLAEGTLVLLGGRRAILTKDGALRVETTPAPAGLHEIIQVPNAKGELKLVGRSSRGIYRFDDPLGAAVEIARSETLIDHIGSGPGLVAVWDFQSYVPRFIDLDTGKQRPLAGLPALPARAMAFRSAKEGAATFEAAGLAVTTDGGASWRVIDERGARDALRVTGIRLDQETLKAFVYSNGPSAAVDVAGAKLDAMKDEAIPRDEAPLLKWIRLTERDPLEAAAASGVEASGGAAIIASHGLVARVDTKTGAIGDLREFAKGFGLAPCALSRAGRSAWVACTLSEDESNSDFSDPFGVFRVDTASASLTADHPVLRRSGEAEVRTSPSGGLMLLSACTPDDEGDVCVKQPDGSWNTLSVKADLWRSGVGPLADGRVAFVRGLEEGDEPADDADGAQIEKGEPADAPPPKDRPYIVAVDRSGKERRLTTIATERGERTLRAQTGIEEDEDHTLRFVLADDEGVYAVVQHPESEGAAPQRIAQAATARIHAGRGLAIGEGRVLASMDGGSSWAEAPAPARVREALMELNFGALEEPGQLMISEIGAKVDTQLRLGWGQADAVTEARAADPLTTLTRDKAAPATPERTVSCTTSGAAQVTPVLNGTYEAASLLFKGKPPLTKAPIVAPPKGAQGAPAAQAKPKNVRTSQSVMGRAGLLDAVAILEELGAEKASDPPKTWAIRWMDPSEMGAKVRTWSGAPPKGAAYGTTLRSAAAYGGRALFSLRSGSKFYVLRVKASGAVDFAVIDGALTPTAEVQFGAEKSDVIAWVHDNSIVVWLPGEEPRVVANIGGRAGRVLGQPSRESVPVMLAFADVAFLSALPIPPMPKAPAGAKGAPPPAPPAPPPISLEGWTPVMNIARKDAARIPVCAAKPKGARFVFLARQLNLKVDGADHSVVDALYEASVTKEDACVSMVSATVNPARRPSAPAKPDTSATKGKPPAKPGLPAAAPGGPVAWIRVDLAGKRAEGGDRGLTGAARKLSCSLEGKP